MKVQRVVPTCVIMHIASVPPVVPDAFETIQALRLLLVYLPQKPLFDPPAVILRTVQVHLQGFVDEFLLSAPSASSFSSVSNVTLLKIYPPYMLMDILSSSCIPSRL